jgi:hypothetical protein
VLSVYYKKEKRSIDAASYSKKATNGPKDKVKKITESHEKLEGKSSQSCCGGCSVRGIRNITNSCYANSALQLLLRIPEFFSKCDEQHGNRVYELLCKIYKRYCQTPKGKHVSKNFANRYIRELIKELGFISQEPDDAYDFLTKIIRTINNEGTDPVLSPLISKLFSHVAICHTCIVSDRRRHDINAGKWRHDINRRLYAGNWFAFDERTLESFFIGCEGEDLKGSCINDTVCEEFIKFPTYLIIGSSGIPHLHFKEQYKFSELIPNYTRRNIETSIKLNQIGYKLKAAVVFQGIEGAGHYTAYLMDPLERKMKLLIPKNSEAL